MRDSRTGPSRRAWVAAVLAGVVIAALGVAGGWALAFVPADVDPPQTAAATYPIEFSPYNDARAVTVEFEESSSLGLRVHASGVLTAWDCEAGSDWASGDVPLAINGRPVLALATEVPPHRDLVFGNSGSDVLALQAELTDLGFAAGSSGKLDDATVAALRDLRAERLGPRPSGAPHLALAETVWLPTTSVTLLTCDAQLGVQVDPHTAVATLTTAVIGIRFPEPGDLLEGDRILTIGTATVPYTGGAIRDEETLAVILADAEVASFLHRAALFDDMAPLSGRLHLADPVEAAAVPPTALVGVGAGGGCVLGDGSVHPVEIISSSLGLSYVRFTGGAAPAAVQVQPDPATPCG